METPEKDESKKVELEKKADDVKDDIDNATEQIKVIKEDDTAGDNKAAMDKQDQRISSLELHILDLKVQHQELMNAIAELKESKKEEVIDDESKQKRKKPAGKKGTGDGDKKSGDGWGWPYE